MKYFSKKSSISNLIFLVLFPIEGFYKKKFKCKCQVVSEMQTVDVDVHMIYLNDALKKLFSFFKIKNLN